MSRRVQILLIEHDGVDHLYPFSELHCSWELRVGRYSIVERWHAVAHDCNVTVTSDRGNHVRSFLEREPSTRPFETLPTLAIAGHVLLAPSVMRQLIDLCSASDVPIAVYCGGSTIGSFMPAPVATPGELATALDNVDSAYPEHVTVQGHRIERLWQAIDHIADGIQWDASLTQTLVDSSARIHPSAVIDETHGPVMICEDAIIQPLAVISGPAVIGPSSTVRPHADIKHSVIGPGCKVGGEIEESILQGWSNKQHLGFLGHSYICEWVNLGAGTTNSDLKNTYGHVHVTMPWGREDTQRMFVGLLMGDHSKSAIGTQFLTGTVCGVSSNVVSTGFPPQSIPSFRWLDTSYDVDKAVSVAKTVMQRRSKVLGESTEHLLRECAQGEA